MLFNPTISGAISRSPLGLTEIGLWRLMINQQYQGRGYAWKTLDMVWSHIRNVKRANRLVSSFIAGEHGPEAFYLRYGFQKTGQRLADGTEVKIWMTP
jgi:diamine N-acetyltransferase